MDEFLRDIHTSIFKEWILLQKENDYEISLDPQRDNVISIKTKYSYSEVIFNEMNIIELSVTNLTNDEVEFYLHFQMKTMKHAIELFYEMLESIKKLIHKPITKILLSCSGGLTTSYFASKMNEAAKLLFLDYKVDAIGYNELFNVGDQYDIIMLAPQISYMHAKVQEILKDQIVLKIPSPVFAKYDVGKTLSIIMEARRKKKEKGIDKKNPISLKMVQHHNTKILCLSLIRNSERVHIVYRLYNEDNQILLDNEIIKIRMSIQDIFDIIDTIIIQYSDVQLIGLSTPGIINDGYIYSTNVNGLEDINFYEKFKERYSQKLVISNDVNAVAVGYYASQDQYSSLSFLFQPISYYSGVGNIVDGKLLQGYCHIAGEVQYLPLELSADKLILNKTPEGALELVAKTLVSVISLLGPELIVYCCGLIPQIEELKKEIEKYIPKEYIPDIKKIDYLQNYILLGQMILCAQSYKGGSVIE